MPGTDELTISEPEGFTVHDEASANWVIRRIGEARKYAERVEAWAAVELRRAEREERFFLERYGPQLEAWARQRLVANRGRSKTIRMPAGTVGFRTTPPRLAIADDRALLRWCKSNLPLAVVVREQVLKSAVKDHIKSTGECPDGAEVVGGGERFFVK